MPHPGALFNPGGKPGDTAEQRQGEEGMQNEECLVLVGVCAFMMRPLLRFRRPIYCNGKQVPRCCSRDSYRRGIAQDGTSVAQGSHFCRSVSRPLTCHEIRCLSVYTCHWAFQGACRAGSWPSSEPTQLCAENANSANLPARPSQQLCSSRWTC